MRMRSRPSLCLLVLVLAAVALAACGSTGDSVQSQPPGSQPDPAGAPAGRTYLSTGVAGHRLVDGTTVTLTFGDDGNLSVQAGCNTLGTTYTIEDGKLVAENFGGTEMGCDEARHTQDTWIGTFLSSRPTVTAEGDELILVSGDTTLTLRDREVVQPDKPIEGTTWIADTLIEGDAASSVPADPRVYLRFVDGKVEGSDGCNGVGGEMQIASGDVEFPGLNMTAMACGAPGVQAAFAGLFGKTVTVELDGDRLTLTAPGGTGLGFRAE
jgi:heat shock protein HslJ